jgi:hypothetical protein
MCKQVSLKVHESHWMAVDGKNLGNAVTHQSRADDGDIF